MYYMTYTGQQWLKQCLYFGVHPVSYHDIWVHFFSLWREKSLLQVFSGGKEDGSFCHLLLQNFWVFSCPRTRRASPISVTFGSFGLFSTLSPIVSWILFLFLSISISISNFISISLESYLPFFFFLILLLLIPSCSVLIFPSAVEFVACVTPCSCLSPLMSLKFYHLQFLSCWQPHLYTYHFSSKSIALNIFIWKAFLECLNQISMSSLSFLSCNDLNRSW